MTSDSGAGDEGVAMPRSESPIDDASRPGAFTDEELTSLALAADPTIPADPHAVPWNWGNGLGQNLLPEWYMPRPMASRRGRGTRITVVSIVTSLVVICAFGLCVTSGFLQLA